MQIESNGAILHFILDIPTGKRIFFLGAPCLFLGSWPGFQLFVLAFCCSFQLFTNLQ